MEEHVWYFQSFVQSLYYRHPYCRNRERKKLQYTSVIGFDNFPKYMYCKNLREKKLQ